MKWIKISNTNNVYEVILNRPELRNAFNPEMIEEITTVFKEIPATTRVVILRGAGKVFCAGADLEWMKSMVSYTFEENKKDAIKLYDMFQAVQNCRAPILTVVQGAAMGGALGLMAVSDMVIALDSSQFCFSEVRLGLAPAVISSFVLQKSSLGLIAPWMISGKVFSADEALRWGLVHQVVTTVEELEVCLASWVNALLEAAPEAVQATKTLVNQVLSLSEEQAKEFTASLIAARRVSLEGQEGLKSFLEKRTPLWKTSWEKKEC